jgi:hypothetical protein
MGEKNIFDMKKTSLNNSKNYFSVYIEGFSYREIDWRWLEGLKKHTYPRILEKNRAEKGKFLKSALTFSNQHETYFSTHTWGFSHRRIDW